VPLKEWFSARDSSVFDQPARRPIAVARSGSTAPGRATVSAADSAATLITWAQYVDTLLGLASDLFDEVVGDGDD
jgi:hypothetical protein